MINGFLKNEQHRGGINLYYFVPLLPSCAALFFFFFFFFENWQNNRAVCVPCFVSLRFNTSVCLYSVAIYYKLALQMTGVKAVFGPTNDLAIDMDWLTANIQGKCMVVVVNPGNPSGCLIPHATLEAISQLCKQNGVWSANQLNLPLLKNKNKKKRRRKRERKEKKKIT